LYTPFIHDALASAHDKDDELQALLVSDTALQLTKLLIPGISVELYCLPVHLVLTSVVKCLSLSIPSTILVSAAVNLETEWAKWHNPW
jgi:hypothetical protein